MYRQPRQAFTLIELLVVIAIIAILAAILFPVFAKVREKARQTACMSNLKQIALGITQYTQDYDETFPGGVVKSPPPTPNPGGGAARATGAGLGWAGECATYIKSTQVFRCPDDTTAAPGTPVAPNPQAYIVSYGMNEFLPQQTLASLAAPAGTVLIFEMSGATAAISLPDEGASSGANTFSPIGDGWPSRSTDTVNYDYANAATCNAGGCTYNNTPTKGLSQATGGALARHDPQPKDTLLGGSEYILADGHVKFLRAQTVSNGLQAAPDSLLSKSCPELPTGGNGGGPCAATFDMLP